MTFFSRRLLSVEDYREAAQARLPRIAYDYLERGAEDELSYAGNRGVFREIEFNPRTLRGVNAIDLSVRLFGQESRLPLVVGPTGFAGLFWPDADSALARAAAEAGVPFVLSTASTTSMEDVAHRCTAAGTKEGAQADAMRWFQLYILNDQEATSKMIRRADAAGYGALVLTVDTPCSGKREASLRHGSRLPLRLDAEKLIDFACHPSWSLSILRHGQPRLANFPHTDKRPFVMESHLKRQIGWGDVEWLRAQWKKPIIIKGIQSVEDARLAASAGIDAIVLSNHGGRQLDGSPSPMRLLPEVAAAVGDQVAVMVDSGFRRGSDVVKALALGARAVWIGRATLYGVATSGEQGAQSVLSILEDELVRTMILLGVDSVGKINASVVRGASEARPWPKAHQAVTGRKASAA